MRRSALHRRTPLGRGAPLTRSKPVRERNSKRKAKTFARCFGDRAAAVREMPCLACVARGSRQMAPTQAAHARARGLGGVKGNSSDLVPLCAFDHELASEFGTSKRAAFEARAGLDLTACAASIAADLDARGLPRAEPDKVQRKRDRA
jgi:hypothetical protein